MSNDEFIIIIIIKKKTAPKKIELKLGSSHETIITLESNYKKNNKVKFLTIKQFRG